VNDTIGSWDIGGDDLGAVNVNLAILDLKTDLFALHDGQRESVGQISRQHLARKHPIAQDVAQFLGLRQLSLRQTIAAKQGVERSVCRCEDREGANYGQKLRDATRNPMLLNRKSGAFESR